MKNIWRKMRDCWLDFWEDDELDMDKKHLSQQSRIFLHIFFISVPSDKLQANIL